MMTLFSSSSTLLLNIEKNVSVLLFTPGFFYVPLLTPGLILVNIKTLHKNPRFKGISERDVIIFTPMLQKIFPENIIAPLFKSNKFENHHKNLQGLK